MIHEYDVATETATGAVELETLVGELSSLTYDQIKVKDGKIIINTTVAKTSFDPIVSAHQPSAVNIYKSVVRSAIDFFEDLMVNYAAENITMGITVLNKTKEVADYLADVMRYGQSGSLYEVMHEIDTLIAAGIPADLSPFVTNARLTDFKNNVQDYLNG